VGVHSIFTLYNLSHILLQAAALRKGGPGECPSVPAVFPTLSQQLHERCPLSGQQAPGSTAAQRAPCCAEGCTAPHPGGQMLPFILSPSPMLSVEEQQGWKADVQAKEGGPEMSPKSWFSDPGFPLSNSAPPCPSPTGHHYRYHPHLSGALVRT